MATMLNGVSAETLTEDEALALGLSTIVHAGQIDPDNYAVNAALSSAGLPQVDKEGRPIISFKQYEEIGRVGGRVDNYAIRVMRPGVRGTWIVQASKYLKWYGLGYEAVGTPAEHTHLALEIRRIVERELAAEVDIEGLNENAATKKVEQFINKHREAISAEIAKRMGHAPARRPVRTVEPIEAQRDDEITFYFCRDKYPECKRAFDSQQGLKLHWRKDHEGAFKPRAKKAVA